MYIFIQGAVSIHLRKGCVQIFNIKMFHRDAEISRTLKRGVQNVKTMCIVYCN